MLKKKVTVLFILVCISFGISNHTERKDTPISMPVMVIHSTSTPSNQINTTELQCMSDMVYREAVGEGVIGWAAVAHVALNRRDSENFPKNLCDVVYQRIGEQCQYPWACEKRKAYAFRDSEEYEQIKFLVRNIMSHPNRHELDPTEGSLYFKRVGTKSKWFAQLNFKKRIGDHAFYTDS